MKKISTMKKATAIVGIIALLLSFFPLAPFSKVTTVYATAPDLVCGNGILEAGEGCEPPNTATCDANCQPIVPICGDGVINQDSEQCEPPNTATCDANCQPRTPLCGDGYVNQIGEICDLGAQNGVIGSGCTTLCAPEPPCGNGRLDEGETCDPNDPETGAGCRDNCTKCGDGNKDPGEKCDGELWCTDQCDY